MENSNKSRIIKRLIASLIGIFIYMIGMVSYQAYSARVDAEGWTLESIVLLLIAVFLVVGPVINHWEAKAKGWLGVKDETEK